MTTAAAYPRGKQWQVPLLVSAIYLAGSALLVGFKVDQLFLAVLFSVGWLANTSTRRWVLGFAVFMVYWVLFDWMKALPNYLVNPVHIGDLHTAELRWFGVGEGADRITLNSWFAARTAPSLDLLAGLFYLCWVPVPLAFAAYLFTKDTDAFLRFALTFLTVNLLGFVVYYLYPAAPPWYVAQYGLEFDAATPGNTAGLIRFDELVGIPLFTGMYSKSSNVFAAMPSLHAAYLVTVVHAAWRFGLRRFAGIAALLMLGIWWAAVYSGHHYVLDVLAGIACAIVAILLFRRLLRWPVVARAFAGYRAAIAPPVLDEVPLPLTNERIHQPHVTHR